MKRWIAGLLGLMLMLAGALPAAAEAAEATEISWDAYETMVEEAEIEATFVVLGDTGVAVWIPDVFLMTYLTDEEETGTEGEEAAEAPDQAETDQVETEQAEAERAVEDPDVEEAELDEEVIAVFGPEDGSALIEISLLEAEEGTTVDSVIRNMAEDEDTYALRIAVNGLDGVYLQDKDNQMAIALIEYEEGQYLQFLFCPLTEEAMREVFEIILASIQKVEIEEAEA